MYDQIGICFEEVAEDFTPLVTGMLKRLRIYKNRDEFRQVGFIDLQCSYLGCAFLLFKGYKLA
ncbi:hypothetical protein [Salibacterium aidingense]|uniref:hypothetical protein n=1 Tax=Salibacterium aidingense TaxID=384933 RepID=UPI00041D1C36|nr:hypothetical protein [Salibacterium aidingense]